MTKVTESGWVAKAQKRKAYRDHQREKFFSEVGLTKGAHVQKVSGAPQDQRQTVQKLMTLTAKGSVLDGAHKANIASAAAALATAGLGMGGMGATAENQAFLEQFSMRNLRDNWFWSPAFFD